MKVRLPLPYFESEGLEDGNRQNHESSTDETNADGFFVTFVHTVGKNNTNLVNCHAIRHFSAIYHAIRHIFVQNIPEICGDMPYSLTLRSEMFNINA